MTNRNSSKISTDETKSDEPSCNDMYMSAMLVNLLRFTMLYHVTCHGTLVAHLSNCPFHILSMPRIQSTVNRLQVQSLWLALLLGLEYSLAGGPEICHLDPHTSLTQSHQTGLGAYGLDVGTGKVILL